MKTLENQFAGAAYGSVSYYIDEERYSSPGSSLYLFSERVAVFVPLRWLLQCVVWAKNDAAQEGGVRQDWVKSVVSASIDGDTAPCANWNRRNGTEERMSLKKRLLTAHRVFTVVENDDDNVWKINTIASDVDSAVFWALDQLGARSWPDLWCVSLNKTSVVPGQTLKTVLENGQSFVQFSKNVVVRTPLLALDVTLVESLERIPELVGQDLQDKYSAETLSVLKMVRTWLVGEIPGGVDDDDPAADDSQERREDARRRTHRFGEPV